MKQILFILAFGLLSLESSFCQTNFQIEPFVLKKGFSTDTATTIRFKCVSLDIDLMTDNQRPVFYLELVSNTGATVDARNVSYQDLINAATKAGIPEEQHATKINQLYSAVFCGTKSQKIASIGAMMAPYGIILISSQ
ncbi:MAG: hypothetical protein LCH91_13935 [Bacteroidetes bacterium]|nr:hypothetical protein [Bacteroidota bacterium]